MALHTKRSQEELLGAGITSLKGKSILGVNGKKDVCTRKVGGRAKEKLGNDCEKAKQLSWEKNFVLGGLTSTK